MIASPMFSITTARIAHTRIMTKVTARFTSLSIPQGKNNCSNESLAGMMQRGVASIICSNVVKIPIVKAKFP